MYSDSFEIPAGHIVTLKPNAKGWQLALNPPQWVTMETLAKALAAFSSQSLKPPALIAVSSSQEKALNAPGSSHTPAGPSVTPQDEGYFAQPEEESHQARRNLLSIDQKGLNCPEEGSSKIRRS